MNARKPVTVIGIGDDGCASLSSRAVNAVARAQVLVGGERQLAFFPQFTGRRVTLRNGIGPVLEEVAGLAYEHNVCILASGDPLFYGIGSLVARRLGGGQVEFLPQPSAVQLAFARLGVKWDDATVLSVHGRNIGGLITRLRESSKVALLTDDTTGPREIARRLLEYGATDWQAWVCEALGGPGERVRRFDLPELAACEDIQPLNVLLLLRAAQDWRCPPRVPFLHEEHFAKRVPKKGLITKREVRALALAALRIPPDGCVWDIGAGSGSVAIEAALLAPQGRVYAVELDPEGVALCRENCVAHRVDNVRVIEGRAPEALAGLEPPDAVFVGGSKGSLEAIAETVLRQLRPGGRLAVNAITLENVAQAYQALRSRGLEPEVLLVNVSRGAPLAGYVRYEALNPVHILVAEKPREEATP